MKIEFTMLAIVVLLCSGSNGWCQSSVEWRVYLEKLEAAKATAQKNLSTAEQALAMAKADLASAQANVKHEDIYEYRDFDDWVSYANGTRRWERVHRKVKVGSRDIPDPTVPDKLRNVAFYQAQVDSGRANAGQYDSKIAQARQSFDAAVQREQTAAASAKPANAIQQPAPATQVSPSPVEDSAPAVAAPTVATVSEPMWKRPWVWVVGIVIVLAGFRWVVGALTS